MGYLVQFLSARDNLNKRHSVNAADVKSKVSHRCTAVLRAFLHDSSCCAQLEAKLSNCDMESEALGDDFVNGVVDLQTFLQVFSAI